MASPPDGAGGREPDPGPGRLASIVRGISLIVIVVGLLVLLRRVPTDLIATRLGTWLDGLGPWAPVVFGLIYAVAVVFMIPGSALTLAGGAIFGPLIGGLTVTLAANLGAALAFLIARYLARDAVARRVGRNPRFDAIDRAIGAEGWKIVALLRLSPAVPFTLQNYLYGLTRIGFWSCTLATAIAMIPGTLLYVYLGHVGRVGLEAATDAGRSRSPLEWSMIAVGLLATVAVTVLVTRLARRAMQRQGELTRDGDRVVTPDPGPATRPSNLRHHAMTVLLVVTAYVVTGVVVFVEWPRGPRRVVSRPASVDQASPGLR